MDALELFRAIAAHGPDKIPAIKLLRNVTGLDLLTAKNVVDVLSGTHLTVQKENYAPPDVVTRRMEVLEAHIRFLTSAHSRVVEAIRTANSLEEIKQNLWLAM